MSKLSIAVLPTGTWGTALTIPLTDNGHNVTNFFLSKEELQNFNKGKIEFKRKPKITNDLKEAVKGKDILILACSSNHVREFFQKITPFLEKKTIILCVAKGIEKQTNLSMSEVLCQIDPKISSRLAIMSGPNFAQEVAQRLPTLTVIASKNNKVAKLLQKTFASKNFKVLTQDDVLGVELGGALKNVLAIGVGIVDGLHESQNMKAALITRGISEMVSLGTTLGANKSTFVGLSGLGDLILCCTSDKSRNYKAGLMIGQGVDSKTLLSSGETIEGLHTVKAVVVLAKRKNVKIPIMEMVYKIVYQDFKPKQAFEKLMKIELSSED